MTEQIPKNNKETPQPPDTPVGDQLDAAGKSLSDALRISFGVLKVIMVVLVLFYLFSGFKIVSQDERAIVLRFGKIRGKGEKRILGPGLQPVLPYPIEQMVRFNVGKKVDLAINSFWYSQNQAELLQGPKSRARIPPRKLNPLREGYCIVRSEREKQKHTTAAGNDYNIVHSKWQLTYRIDDPERFFRNVHVDDVKPGQDYFDVVTQSVMPLLRSIVEDAVVTTMVHYTIDQAYRSDYRIPKHVQKLVQQKLDAIDSGITASVKLVDATWPRQVDGAFEEAISASQTSEAAITEAKTYAETILNEAAGPLAAELLKNTTFARLDEAQKDHTLDNLAGQGQQIIAQAKAYRTNVVEAAEANARYLHALLPEYRRHPQLVINEIYQEAMEHILERADEKIIIQPTTGSEAPEIWLRFNRDPAIKPKKSKKANQENQAK